MSYKWAGAILIITGCGGFGFSLSASYKRQSNDLKMLVHVIRFMCWELQYRRTPLPEVCKMAAKVSSGTIQNVFRSLKRELEWQYSPDVSGAMQESIKQNGHIATETRRILLMLGKSLGRFDLDGQLESLNVVKAECEQSLLVFQKNQTTKLRTYQTLGLCAGAALAIIFA